MAIFSIISPSFLNFLKRYLCFFSIAFFLLKDIAGFSQSFSSSNLPLVVINTYGQFIDTVNKNFIVGMGVIDNGPGNRNYLTDQYNEYNGNIEIELHGSSTLAFPKKSYGITTINEFNKQIKVSLLGMPPEDDWVLKAHYQDKTLIRDNLSFKVFKDMGHYSARTRFVELIVDGDYKGVYEVQEKIRRGDYRVDISKLRNNDLVGDDLTGGYIIKLDKFLPEDEGWYSNYKSNLTHDSANYFLYHYPKPAGMPQVQKDYIKNFFNKFEDVLVSPYFNHPDSGYSKYLNVTSFIDNFLINEVSRNVDGYRSSTYFYKEKDSDGDGKLHCGPIWDFNLAWKNCSYNGGNNPAGWQYQQFASQNFVPFWWWQIMSDNTFKNQLRCRYQYLRANVLNATVLNQYIDEMALYLDEAQIRNFNRWPIMGQLVYPNPAPVPTSYAGEISNLKDWVQQRLAWLDQNLTGICTIGVDENNLSDDFVRCFPNPFPNSFNVIYQVPENMRVSLELLNVFGEQVVVHFNGEKAAGIYQEEISTQHLASGMYILKLSLNDNAYYQKLTKL